MADYTPYSEEHLEAARRDVEKTFTQSKGEREMVNKIRNFFGAKSLPTEKPGVKSIADIRKIRGY